MSQADRRGNRSEPVVITGLGAVTVYGDGVDALWSGLRSNVSGVHDLVGIPPARGKTRGAQIVTPHRNRLFRALGMAVDATTEALEMAGPDRLMGTSICGLYIGTTGGHHRVVEDLYPEFLDAQSRLHAGDQPVLSAALSAGLRGYPFRAFAADLATRINHEGPRIVVSNACASGNIALALAVTALRRGTIDRAIVVGADELRASSYWGAERSGFIGHDLRPFHKNRDGSVMGDGAAAIVLERFADATYRGVEPLAQVSGWGIACDRFPHEIIPPEDGLANALAIESALSDGMVAVDEIDYFNAHGTGTPRIDSLETVSIKRVMGEGAYRVAMNSTKSMTGHLAAASPIVELIATVLQMRHGWVHPTAKLDDIDPLLDLDYVPLKGREQPIRAAISNSLGGGGTNCAIVLRNLQHDVPRPTRAVTDAPDLVITGAATVDGTVDTFSVLDYCSRDDGYHHMSMAAQMGYAAGLSALNDAGIEHPIPSGGKPAMASRIAVVVGTSLGGMPVLSESMARQLTRDPNRITPNMALDHGPQLTATLLCRKTDIRGPIVTLPSGETAGIQGIAVATDLLASGAADQVVVVAVDHIDAATVDATSMLTGTCAPRVGGGAGAIVIESRGNAKARGAHIRSSILNVALWGTASDEDAALGMRTAIKECFARVSQLQPPDTVVVDSNGNVEGPPSLTTGVLHSLMAATPMIALVHLISRLSQRGQSSEWSLACVDSDGHAAAVTGNREGGL